jgi:hypothetical protein
MVALFHSQLSDEHRDEHGGQVYTCFGSKLFSQFCGWLWLGYSLEILELSTIGWLVFELYF